MIAQFLCRRKRLSVFQDIKCAKLFISGVIVHNHYAFLYGRIGIQPALNISGFNPVAADFDLGVHPSHVFNAAAGKKRAISPVL